MGTDLSVVQDVTDVCTVLVPIADCNSMVVAIITLKRHLLENHIFENLFS